MIRKDCEGCEHLLDSLDACRHQAMMLVDMIKCKLIPSIKQIRDGFYE